MGLFSKGGGRRGLTRAPAAWAASAFGRPEHKIAHMGRCFHMFDHHGQYGESSQAHMSTCNAFLFPLPPPMSNERPTHHTDAAWMLARHSFSPGQGPRQSSVSLLCRHHRRLHPSFMVAKSRPPPLPLHQGLVVILWGLLSPTTTKPPQTPSAASFKGKHLFKKYIHFSL